MSEIKKYIVSYAANIKRYSVTIPKALMNGLNRKKGDSVFWKIHPNGKDLVLEFER